MSVLKVDAVQVICRYKAEDGFSERSSVICCCECCRKILGAAISPNTQYCIDILVMIKIRKPHIYIKQLIAHYHEQS
jgi:hypothetical protein